ncbi:glycosyltransferase family 1 protein [Candidatus Bathyarchaeota archaeon]|nr:glycosyltransferase family 1 protein [Candidatus Bathyarchaeota archaeon]
MRFFKIGEGVITYDNELPYLVQYYLSTEDEIRGVSERARQKALRDHT